MDAMLGRHAARLKMPRLDAYAPANSEQSTVYSIREWTLRQSFLPLVYCTVVAVMGSTKPLGAYVPLPREPGSRKNKVKGGTF